MPKILEQVKNKILEAAKKQIFEEGINGFSLRSIAKECEIAPSTIYNYFKNKEELIAIIVAEDWFEILAKMDKGIEEAVYIEEGFLIIYSSIREFVRKYSNVWSQFHGPIYSISSRHLLLIDQIKVRIDKILDKFEREKNISNVLAECILTCSIHHEINEEEYLNFIKRLFK